MICCIFSAATLAFGQSATTSLRGVVKDPSGAVLPGAQVTLANKANGKTLDAIANNVGLYQQPVQNRRTPGQPAGDHRFLAHG
jgi:hypothetical protein